MCASRLVEAGASGRRAMASLAGVTRRRAWRAWRPRGRVRWRWPPDRSHTLGEPGRAPPFSLHPPMFLAAARRTAARLAPRSAAPPPSRRRAVAASASGLDPPDVRKLAEMAHIDVTDAEVGEERKGRGGLQRPPHPARPPPLLFSSGRRLDAQDPQNCGLV
jgi:hypothetical protein